MASFNQETHLKVSFTGMQRITLRFHDFFFSRYVRPGNGFVPNFQLFAKDDVNGKNEQGVYTFLKVKIIFAQLWESDRF